MGTDSSSLLKKALLSIRKAAPRMPDPQLQAAASKQFREFEFLPATKELLCMWIHMEAVDQGGKNSPPWLLRYLKLSLYASDYLLTDPTAMFVMDSHSLCYDLKTLQASVCSSLAKRLGFGSYSRVLAPALLPLLTTTRTIRQDILRRALTERIDLLN